MFYYSKAVEEEEEEEGGDNQYSLLKQKQRLPNRYRQEMLAWELYPRHYTYQKIPKGEMMVDQDTQEKVNLMRMRKQMILYSNGDLSIQNDILGSNEAEMLSNSYD